MRLEITTDVSQRGPEPFPYGRARAISHYVGIIRCTDDDVRVVPSMRSYIRRSFAGERSRSFHFFEFGKPSEKMIL